MRMRTTAWVNRPPSRINRERLFSSRVRSGVAVFLLAAASPMVAQEPDTVGEVKRPPRGSQFLLPYGSLLVPGLGQYVQGAPLQGAAYTATAVAGWMVAQTDDTDLLVGGLPRNGRDQFAYEGVHVALSAGMLSGWDSFRRAVPALQQQGKYEFLTSQEDLGDLLTAPLDFSVLDRWTTWVDLAFTGLVTGLVLADRQPGRSYKPYRANDAAFITALSLNAGIGEEAMFRGWLLPVFHQTTGERFWIGNTLQAGIFGGLHAEQAGAFAFVQTAWALYEGWLTRRNDWSIRESIFHHFWYDMFVATAEFLSDERQATIRIRFPTIRF